MERRRRRTATCISQIPPDLELIREQSLPTVAPNGITCFLKEYPFEKVVGFYHNAYSRKMDYWDVVFFHHYFKVIQNKAVDNILDYKIFVSQIPRVFNLIHQEYSDDNDKIRAAKIVCEHCLNVSSCCKKKVFDVINQAVSGEYKTVIRSIFSMDVTTLFDVVSFCLKEDDVYDRILFDFNDSLHAHYASYGHMFKTLIENIPQETVKDLTGYAKNIFLRKESFEQIATSKWF